MHICMLAYTHYDNDNRVRRYAETLVKRGDTVDIISLRRAGQTNYSKLNGVSIYRIQERELNEKGILSYLYRLLKFLIRSTFFVGYHHLRNPYDLIHVHSVPDFEVFAALVPKLAGKKIILDIHDLVPEFYGSKFGKTSESLIFKWLVFIEKVSIAFSDHVIISNHIWYETLISRSVNRSKCTVIMNYPDKSIFSRKKSLQERGKFIMMYPGSLNWHQGLDIAIKAFAMIKDQIPEAVFHIYGDGPTKNDLVALIREFALENRVCLKGFVTIDKIAEIMANASIGIIPKRNDSFGGDAFSTKILEFMSLGVPVIVSKTRIDQYYFDESIVKFFEPDDEKNLADVILLLIKNRDLREKLAQNALKFVAKNSWDVKKYLYLNLVDSLLDKQKK